MAVAELYIPREQPRRLVAPRWQRVWQMVEWIAANPGVHRGEVADHFHLSERQAQADLLLIRDDLQLPLTRDSGYRFQDEGWSGLASDWTLADLLGLFDLMRAGINSLPRGERHTTLVDKLPASFPPHLRPLAVVMTEAIGPKPSTLVRAVSAVAGAIVRGHAIRVRQTGPNRVALQCQNVVIRPAALLPIRGVWHVLGSEHVARIPHERLLPLDAATVTLGANDGY